MEQRPCCTVCAHAEAIPRTGGQGGAAFTPHLPGAVGGAPADPQPADQPLENAQYPGEGVEEREPSCSAGGKVKRCNHHAKQYGGSSRKLKTDLPYHLLFATQQFRYWVYTQRNKTSQSHLHSPLHHSIAHNCQDLEPSQCYQRRNG